MRYSRRFAVTLGLAAAAVSIGGALDLLGDGPAIARRNEDERGDGADDLRARAPWPHPAVAAGARSGTAADSAGGRWRSARAHSARTDPGAHAGDRRQPDGAPTEDSQGGGQIVVEQAGWTSPLGLPAASGRDTAAPRLLALWRIDPASGARTRLASRMSRPDGSFRFGQLLVPGAGAWVQVLPDGIAPEATSADPTWLAGRPPDPPRAFWTTDGVEVRGVWPDAVAVARHADGWEYRRSVSELSAVDIHSVAQRLPDGRTSAWVTPIFLEAPTVLEAPIAKESP